MVQVLINIIFSLCLYLFIGFGLNQNFKVLKTINIVYASYIPLSAYITFYFNNSYSLPFLISAFISIILIVTINTFIESLILSILRNRVENSLISLLATLGLYIIVLNTISIFWGDSNQVYSINYSSTNIKIFSGVITSPQVYLIVVCFLSILILSLIQHNFLIGRKIKAVSSNPNLSELFGINKSYIFILTSMFTSAIMAIAGILISMNIGFYPSMGFNLFIYGFIVIIIGGLNSNFGLFIGALILSASQHLSAFVFDSKWFNLVSYVVLIIFLFWRPLGFSGNQLKKVEI